MALSFRLLSQADIYHNRRPLSQFRSQKEQALLIYLAHTGTSHGRDAVAELLWSGRTVQRARSNLRTALTRLRKRVNEDLLVTRRSLALAPESRQDVDSVNLLTELATVGQLETLDDAEALDNILAIYRGHFLAGFDVSDTARFDEWVTTTREYIRGQVIAGYSKLGDFLLARHDADWGIAVARRWLQVDAMDEAAHLLLLRMLVISGREREAVTHYDDCVQTVCRELGVEPSAEVRALIHRIRPQPLAIYRLFPSRQHNLPAPQDQFFGRQVARKELHARLGQPWCRLVTVVGPGGIGKTRLATTVARGCVDRYADGVWLVELANISPDDPNVAEAIAVELATAMDLRLKGSEKPAQQVLTYLEHKQVLLLLDNFDHLIEDGVQLLLEIIQRCESVQLLVTSREPLGVRAEWILKLSGLGYPASDADEGPFEAVDLFMARRNQHQWQEMDPGDLVHARRIVRILEGWPLAIELAAGLMPNATLSGIADELSRGFETLTTSLRDVPERHRSLRTVFEASWHSLSLDLQRRLARLSVFHSGFTQDAAQQIAGADATHLEALCTKSLLSYSEATVRYRLHPAVRTFAAARLASDDPARQDHARYYLSWLAQYADAFWKDQPRQAIAMIDSDIDNGRAAWQEGLTARETDLLLAALPALSAYYRLQGLAREGEAIMQATWRAAMAWGPAGAELAIWAGLERARFLNRLGRHRPSIQTLTTTFELVRQQRDRRAEGMAHVHWGEALWRLGEHRAAKAKLHYALEVAHALDDIRLTGWAHHHLGIIDDIQGRYAAAYDHLHRAQAAWQSLDDFRNLSNSLNSMGLVCYHQGDLPTAQEMFEQALALCTWLDDRHLLSLLFNNLGILAIEQGDHAQAQHYLGRGLELAIHNGNLTSQGELYVNFGRNYRLMGRTTLAISSLEQGLDIAQSISNRSLIATAMMQLARAKQEQRQTIEAEALLHQSLVIARQHHLPSMECEALLGMAELLHEHNAKRAQECLAQAIVQARAIQSSHLITQAETLQHLLSGRVDVNGSALPA